MAHAIGWARRLLRELPKDPEKLLKSKSYADSTFLSLYFDHLDEIIYRDPRKALRWAKIAPDLALKAPESKGPGGHQRHREQLVMAWVISGGAYRACGDHETADTAYENAFKILKSEAIRPLIRAVAEHRCSYLRSCQGRIDEALKLAEGAVTTLRTIDSDREPKVRLRLGEALISLGYVLVDDFGRHAEGLEAFGEALLLAGAVKDPAMKRLHTSACHNLADTIASSSVDDARAMGYLKKAKTQLKGQRRNAARYRLLWVEALIWNKRGAHAKAEVLFLQALDGFKILRLPFEIALLGLDLGAVYQLCGQWEKIETLAAETLGIFRALNGTTGAVMALSQWLNAVRRRAVDEAIVVEARAIILKGISTGCCGLE